MKDGRSGADDDRSRAIAGDRPIDRGRRRAHLRVLRFRDVHEALRRGVDDVEKLRRGRGRRMGTGASVDRRKKRARRGATRPPAAAKRGKYEKRLLARRRARARDRRFATHLHDRRAVVGDRRHALIVVHELIETARALRIARERRQRDDRGGRGKTSKMARDLAEGGGRGWTRQRRADGVHDRHARVDVRDELPFPLGRVRALAEEHDLRLLRGEEEEARGGSAR